jgi:hypothetical protein
MTFLRLRLLTFLTAVSLLIIFAPAAHAASSDIQGHWSESAVRSLIQAEVLNGYPDGSFKPDQSITRAEFTKILSSAYDVHPTVATSFSDVKTHWAKDYIAALSEKKVINGYPDGTFRPERPISRAEMATMLSRIINLGNSEEKFTMEMEPSFPDVNSDFWAFRNIEIVSRLGILPAHYRSEFQATRLASRADTAWMVNSLRELKTLRGKVLDNADGSGFLTVEAESGDVESIILTPDTVVFRNNITTTLDKINRNDSIALYPDITGSYRFAKAYGDVNKDDLLGRISAMTEGKVTPNQVTAILAGNWDSVKEELKGGVYEQLLDIGLEPSEAEGLLVQDWEYMSELSRERLSDALSGYLGITQDLSQAILDRDMDRAKEYAKIELATMAVSRLMQQGGFDS